MEALEYFDPYTSYALHWFPYEIIYCSNLMNSRVSTRALYGNYKYRNAFPSLANNTVIYQGASVCCSVCREETPTEQLEQYWISLEIGTDVLPLLAHICSTTCKEQLPTPPTDYIAFPHKGGPALEQPLEESALSEIRMKEAE